MKNKLISILTLLSMLISMFAFGTTSFAAGDSVSDAYAIGLIESLGIVNTEIDELDNKVSRENFAVYVAKMLKGDSYNTDARYFTDVERTAYSYDSVNFLAERGIISIPDNKRFRPGDNVTYDEATKMIVSALGGDLQAQKLGEYPYGYHFMAKRLGVSISPIATDSITTREAINLIYKALIAETHEVYDDGSASYTSDATSLLNSIWDIYYGEGTIDAVYGVTLDSNIEAEDKKQIYINGERYSVEPTTENLRQYAGSYVGFFYTDDDNVKKIHYMEEDNRKDKVELSIVEDYEGYAEGVIEARVDGKRKSYTLKRPFTIIYNGKEVNNTISTMNSLNKGTITIKDGNNDGEYDTVIVWDYDNFYVATNTNETIYNGYKVTGKTSDSINFEDVEQLTIFNHLEEELAATDIVKDDVLSVARSQDDKNVLMYKASSVVTGKVSSIDGDDGTYEINNTEYKADPSFADELADKIDFSTSYTFTIDMFGYICAVKDAADTEALIPGFVLTVGEDRVGLSKSLQIELLALNGEIIICQLGERVTIESEKYKLSKNFDKIKTHLTANATDKVIAYRLDESATASTDDMPVISEIDTLSLGVDEDVQRKEDSLSCAWGGALQERLYLRSKIGPRTVVRTTTPVFLIPKDEVDKGDEDFYGVTTVSSEFEQDKEYYAEVYKLKGTNGYGDVVVNATDTVNLSVNIDYNKTAKVYLRSFMKRDEDDDFRQCIEVMDNNGVAAYFVENGRLDMTAVEVGDIIDFDFTKKMEIDASKGLRLVYDHDKAITNQPMSGKWGSAPSEPEYMLYNYVKGDGQLSSFEGYRRKFQLSHGIAYEVYDDGVISMCPETASIKTDLEYIPADGIKVIVVSEGDFEPEVREGTVNDIVSYTDAGDCCSRLVHHTRDMQSRLVIVYNGITYLQ